MIASLILLLGLAGPVDPTTAPADQEPSLEQRVLEFFKTPEGGARSRLLGIIVNHSEAGLDQVAEAVRNVQVWEPMPAGLQSLDVEYGAGRSVAVRVRVPEAYDHTKRYPLILALHGQGQGALNYLQYLEQVLGAEAESFILAAPQDYTGTWFEGTAAEAEEPVAILGALRRRYHVDTDRVYVNGYSLGGHGSFMCGVLYTDAFASAISLAGTFTTPNTPQTKPTLLLNLVGFPMLLVWGEHDTRDRNQEETQSGGIAGLNRTLQSELPEMGVTGVEFIELTDRGHRDVVPPRDRFLHYLQLRRDNDRKEVLHWFRFPAQGRMGWMRQTEFAGEPWEGQIVVRVRPGDDVQEFARRAVQRKLALLEGTIEGQTIRIRVQRTQAAELLLHEGLIDLTQPITIYRREKILFEGPVAPSISTLLTLAYDDWEFQRLPSVRIVVPGRGKARQD